ncbi:MAG: YfhO family protein, partial [Candidatus Auribacterota bacterium]|nr:YfhO family protein [Candidatus Auribacterota bacterium]
LFVLGRHTPFYYFFYKWIPVYSRFPFPIRYRLLQVIATAWLAGLGMEYLLSWKRASSCWEQRLVWWYIGLSGLAAVLALSGFEGIRGWFSGQFLLPGLDEIVRRSNLQWFISGPVFYFFAAGFFLILAWRGLRGKRREIAVAILVILEIVCFTFAAFYFCIFRFHEPQPQQIRSLGPSNHPMVQRVLDTLAAQRLDRSLRWATDQPFHDNFARLDPSESYAFMGYDMKPLEKRFKKAFEEAYGRPVGWPLYWEYPQPVYPSFLGNMSVGYLLDSRPENIFRGGKTVKLESTPDFYLHFNENALPRAFTLDRIVECSEDEALNKLVKEDLREAVFIDDGSQLGLINNQEVQAGNRPLITDYHSFPPVPEYIKRFNELQSVNPIQELDLTNPNRIEVVIAVTKPAMLVLTEIWYPGWEARVDGEPTELFRVNYLQRGVWLNEGEHRVELVFRPKSWMMGMIISIVSWGILVLVLLVRLIWGRIKRYHPPPESMGVNI